MRWLNEMAAALLQRDAEECEAAEPTTSTTITHTCLKVGAHTNLALQTQSVDTSFVTDFKAFTRCAFLMFA